MNKLFYINKIMTGSYKIKTPLGERIEKCETCAKIRAKANKKKGIPTIIINMKTNKIIYDSKKEIN